MEATHRAAPGSYFILIGLLGLPSLGWMVVTVRNPSDGYEGLLVSLCLPLLCLAWLASFRLTFTEAGITYRSLFGGTRTAVYSDIKSIGTSRSSPFSRLPLGITIKLHGGKEIVVNTKPFPVEAMRQLLEIAESNKLLHATRETRAREQ